MAGNLLSIGKSGLFAAQAGLSTTGHNITNANVAGFSRQVVVQATSTALDEGYGFSGTGTKIAQIKRYTDEFLNAQVRTAQASTSALEAYQTQISQIDNLLADSTSGLSPTLQNFFNAVQDLTAGKGSVPSRQALLSAADTLASRFQALDGRLGEIREGVNKEISSNVSLINSYASEIAELNEKIASFATTQQRAPNDLMDARDQLVLDLNKQVKATVVPGANGSLTVSIGTGQPLVVGQQAFRLAVTASPTDPTRVEVGYVMGQKVSPLSENILSGGELGGLLEFRSGTLDRAQNSLGRIAIGMASTFNLQHRLGLDQAANPGGEFFNQAVAAVGKNINNNKTSTAAVSAVVTDPTKLTASDYRVEYDGADFHVIRLSDRQDTVIAPYPQVGRGQEIDGVTFTIDGSADTGDNFLVRPTINGAADFKVKLSDVSQVAAAAPVVTSTPLANIGTGKISAGSVDPDYLTTPAPLPLTLDYAAASGELRGFPAQQVVMDVGGTRTTFAAGAPVPFTSGASYTVGGVSFSIGGAPGDGDLFTIARNNTGVGDTRNAGLLGKLQSTNIFNDGSATYQSAYAELVSLVGNKTREVQVNAEAGEALLTQARGAAQDVSGVNLDEEATNLLKYQQAYQAAGKVMQIASTIFDTLLSIGR
jgi:flagellar hook-associated protein 1 FlgK